MKKKYISVKKNNKINIKDNNYSVSERDPDAVPDIHRRPQGRAPRELHLSHRDKKGR